MRTLIAWAGDDPEREGLLDTPDRVVKAYEELFGGYYQDARWKPCLAPSRRSAATTTSCWCGISRSSPTASTTWCPSSARRISPTTPKAGSSACPSSPGVVEIFARRLQTQENLTAQIIDAINEHPEARAARRVMIEAEHMCMSMRGVHKHGASTVTTQFTGIFQEDAAERTRFLDLVRNR